MDNADASSVSAMFTADECHVIEILTQLPDLISQFETPPPLPLPKWGCKRRRSAIDVRPHLPPSSSPSHHGAAAKASSPATPLLFSPSDSDQKPNLLKRKFPLKKKREDYLAIIEDLTKSRDLLRREIEKVKHSCDELKAFNLKLKARKQELSLDPKTENPCLERSLKLVHASVNSWVIAENQQQLQLSNGAQYVPKIVDQLNETEEVRRASSQAMTSLPSIRELGMVNCSNNMGPLGIPDLNVAVEESMPAQTDYFPQLLHSMPNCNLSRAIAAAQARQNRIRIYRVKNPLRFTKPRHSCR